MRHPLTHPERDEVERQLRAEIGRLTYLNAELLARLRAALHHVENEGDDTLAAMIKGTINLNP